MTAADYPPTQPVEGPAGPERRPKGRMIAISALVLIGVAAGVGLLLRHNAPANATPADNSSTATAAYPLHAHLEQWGSQNDQLAPPSLAQYRIRRKPIRTGLTS